MPKLPSALALHRGVITASMVLAFAMVGSLAPFAVSSATAADTDGIAAAPSDNGLPDTTRSRFSYQVAPGQHLSDEYLVQNTGTTRQLVTVYATDAFNGDDGSFSLLDSGVAPTDVATWVTFNGTAPRVSLTLEPGTSRVIPFVVAVPADARPGDHAGGIIVSALSPSGQITLDRRVGIRLYVRVKGALQPGLTLSSISAVYEPELNPFAGATTVTISLLNSGNVALGAHAITRVNGLFGIPLTEANRIEIPEMLPGAKRTMKIRVEGVGPWMVITPGVDLAPTVGAGAFNLGTLPIAHRDTTLFVVPWGMLLILLVVGLTFLITQWRRRRNERRAAEWVAFTEAETRRTLREESEHKGTEGAGVSSSGPNPTRTGR